MLDVIMFGILAVFILLGVFAVWWSHCLTRTLFQRKALINLIYVMDNWQETRPAFEAVSYNQHMNYMLTLRNPWKLYPALIQEETA